MASDTVPAAATSPDETAGTTPASPQQPRGLAGLLSAVDPARPTGFTLNPTTDTTDQTRPGATSADYHNDNTHQDGTAKNPSTGTGKADQKVWRAWLLAGAERWRKGADARLKALDLKKARAQANQVKESRTVNRSEKFVGGSTNTATNAQNNAGKSLNNKTNNAKKDPGTSRNSHGTTKHGPAGRHGSGGGAGHGPRNGSPGNKHTGGRDTGKNNPPRSGGGRPTSGKDPKPSKTDGGKAPAGGGGSKGGSGSSTGPKHGKTGPGGSAGKDGKPGKDAPARTEDTKTPKSTKDAKGTGGPGKPDKPSKVDLKKKPGSKDRPKPGTTDSAPKTTTGKTATDDKKPAAPDTGKKTPSSATTPGTGTGRPLNTQASRETGYRDGARAAQAANHVIAYRDGVRDGWHDHREHGRREAKQLDKAHADRKQPQPKVPPMPTYAPTASPTVTPIEVTGIDSRTVYLGAGATRPSMGRGEVRNFVTFLARLEAKTDVMNKVADATKGLQAEAEQQATEAIQLLEEAKRVKGGEHLISKLNRLADAANVQAGKAADVHKRALRAAEACKTLHSNVRTRYEPIFKAVVDSPETRPAELRFYRDRGYAPAAA